MSSQLLLLFKLLFVITGSIIFTIFTEGMSKTTLSKVKKNADSSTGISDLIGISLWMGILASIIWWQRK